MKKIFCDICKKELTLNYHRITLKKHGSHLLDELDLCEECFEQMVSFLFSRSEKNDN